jgi:hypothetical protein
MHIEIIGRLAAFQEADRQRIPIRDVRAGQGTDGSADASWTEPRQGVLGLLARVPERVQNRRPRCLGDNPGDLNPASQLQLMSLG